MAGLLSTNDINTIRAALKSVTDTFCQVPVTYQVATESMDLFNQDRRDAVPVSYDLLGLVKYYTQKIDMSQYGAVDLSDGEILFNYFDLVAAGLIDVNKKILMNPATDYMEANGLKLRITGVIPLGQLDTLESVVKIFFMKEERRVQ